LLLVAWLTAWALFSLPWTSATSTPHWERVRAPFVHTYSRIRGDHILNVLFYVPAAPLVAALGWPVSAGIGMAIVMSLTAEGSQVFSEDRAPNGNDVVANIAGGAAGAIGWSLFRRRARQ
jgi:VanZ family protein